jgi:riboflavin kinase/FMN adenylyltransferase
MNTVYRDVAGPCLAPQGSVVCIGAFDGVHRGHRAVLERVRERAQNLHAVPVAVSFSPIPRTYFAEVPQLSSPREKIKALIDAGMERVLMLRFNAALAALTAEAVSYTI